MTPAKVQKILVVLLGVTSACTLALIGLNIARSHARSHARGAAPAAGSTVGRGSVSGAGAGAGADETATQPDPAMVVRGGVISVQAENAVPVLYDAPPFNLTERSGQPLALADLRGRVWIADFIFTQCGSICPRMTQAMAGLQGQLRQRHDWTDIRLISVSVDPDRDTPEILRAYATQNGADPKQWLFVTGRRQVIWPLIRTGFKLPVEDSEKDSTSPILHSGKFVLIDRLGRIRGYYDGLDAQGRIKLVADLGRVLAEPAPPATQPAPAERRLPAGS